jgi:acetyl-CoA decarbonylase/synthase, CODH/ACS complex subunit gamma
VAKKLTGMDIFKLLPKTNCGECGVATCMAFAMKLAQKNAELAQCPYASDEAKTVIGAASEPPIRLVKIGAGERAVAVGNEIVMFRHDKTFVHQTAIAIQCDDTLDERDIGRLAADMESYCIVRVGETLRADMLCVNNASGDAGRFVKAAKAAAGVFKGGLILKSDSPKSLVECAQAVAGRVPLLCSATKDNADEIGDFSLKAKLPLCVKAESMDAAFELTHRLAEKGIRDMIIDVPSGNAAAMIQSNTVVRKAAVSSSVKEMGYPIINFVTGRQSTAELVADASSALCKYASIVVVDRSDKEALLPLLMLRQNIFTDPQKPIQVDAGIYKIGEPGPDAPLVVTTNFSLTYFIVSGELENAGVPVRLAIVDAEGMSVLTAWAARKFNGEKIGAFLKGQNADKQFSSRKLIIPGYVASISGELEEQMPGWEVLVGPQEASDLGPFMKRFLKA